jgi:hypothetical protein
MRPSMSEIRWAYVTEIETIVKHDVAVSDTPLNDEAVTMRIGFFARTGINWICSSRSGRFPERARASDTHVQIARG